MTRVDCIWRRRTNAKTQNDLGYFKKPLCWRSARVNEIKQINTIIQETILSISFIHDDALIICKIYIK